MTGAEHILVDLLVEDPEWEAALPRIEALTAEAAAAALNAADIPAERCAISILLCDDDEIAALNARFRGKETPTNVLSWPAFELEKALSGEVDLTRIAPPAAAGTDGRVFLGDVALALGVVRREAKNAVKSLEAHVAHLIVHGVLHLVGYDHEAEDEAEAMARREVAALSAIGVADPYAEGGE